MGLPEQSLLGSSVCHDPLLRHALIPNDSLTLAMASAIEMARSSSRMLGRGTLGLDIAEFAALLDQFFPGARPSYLKGFQPLTIPDSKNSGLWDEFAELRDLLLSHRKDDESVTRWFAHAVAVCCLGDDHLWQDMGLHDRNALSSLLAFYFPQLFAANTKGMRWKKFLYKCLCESNRAFVCRSPSCQECSEYLNCFGPEEDGKWN